MRPLGELEAAVMQRLWAWQRPTTVREVLDDLRPERPLAYTTVMTVMDTLHRKGLLGRERVGRAYRYTPTSSRAEHAARLMSEVLETAGDPAGTLLRFVDHMSVQEIDALRRAVASRAPS